MSLKPFGELSILKPEFKWIINTKEFDSKKKGESISSPKFFVNNTIQNMYLELYPLGIKNSPDDTVGLFLSNDNDYDVTLDYMSFSLVNNDDEKVNTLKWVNTTVSSKLDWGWKNFIKESFLFDPVNKLITDDKITIVCEINGKGVNVEKKNQNNLSKINEKLFTKKTYSDITVKCGRNKFYLHKCILANRSSVFEAMFDTDMMEKDNNIVVINDISPKVLQQFFKYLYTDTVDDLKEVYKDLLVVADKYLVKTLKDECEEIMCNTIKTENAIEYYKTADIYNLNKLKSKVVKFMAHNRDKLQNNTELESLSKEQLLELYKCSLNLLSIEK